VTSTVVLRCGQLCDGYEVFGSLLYTFLGAAARLAVQGAHLCNVRLWITLQPTPNCQRSATFHNPFKFKTMWSYRGSTIG